MLSGRSRMDSPRTPCQQACLWRQPLAQSIQEGRPHFDAVGISPHPPYPQAQLFSLGKQGVQVTLQPGVAAGRPAERLHKRSGQTGLRGRRTALQVGGWRLGQLLPGPLKAGVQFLRRCCHPLPAALAQPEHLTCWALNPAK